MGNQEDKEKVIAGAIIFTICVIVYVSFDLMGVL